MIKRLYCAKRFLKVCINAVREVNIKVNSKGNIKQNISKQSKLISPQFYFIIKINILSSNCARLGCQK